MPLGCDAATFNPPTITTSGSSTLTVPNCTTPGAYASFVVGTSGTLPLASTVFGLAVGQPSTQTGTGCTVGFSLNPLPPVAGQPLTITGTLQGLASGNTGVAPISLDHMQLCAATSSGACVAPVNSLAAGPHQLEWTCNSSGPGGAGTGSSAAPFSGVGDAIAELEH